MAGLHALVLGLQLIQQLRPILNLNDVVVEKVRVGGVGIQSADEYVLVGKKPLERLVTTDASDLRPWDAYPRKPAAETDAAVIDSQPTTVTPV